MKNDLPKKLYPGTSTEELAGFESGVTDDLLYLTSNYGRLRTREGERGRRRSYYLVVRPIGFGGQREARCRPQVAAP